MSYSDYDSYSVETVCVANSSVYLLSVGLGASDLALDGYVLADQTECSRWRPHKPVLVLRRHSIHRRWLLFRTEDGSPGRSVFADSMWSRDR